MEELIEREFDLMHNQSPQETYNSQAGPFRKDILTEPDDLGHMWGEDRGIRARNCADEDDRPRKLVTF
jgi:hypothetical protein